MAKVFQIGAAGGVGRRLAVLLVQRGDEVSGMHRGAAQADTVKATGATPVLGDLITGSVEDLAAMMQGHNAVVFSAGAHGTGQDKTTLIDGRGLEKAVDAARAAGVSRFVLVSAFPDHARGTSGNPGFEHYMAVKRAADVYLAATDLDWLIVRPGTLQDADGDGLVTAGPAIENRDVARGNVAAFIAEALHTDDLHRRVIELTDGSTPIADAIAALAPAAAR